MKPKLILVLALLALPWVVGFAPRATEQRAAQPRADGPCDPANACFDVNLSPANLIGDFYVDGALVAPGVNSARLVAAPGVPHTIEARNIQEPGVPGFGDLFVYPDQSAVQQTNAGWIWRVIFYPRRTFIKGTFNYLCEPRGRTATDVLACRPTVDGVPMPDVPAGGSASYILPSGPHAVHTDLVGDSAGNYNTTARDDAVNVIAGRNT
ncbi:MAG: hypothetical protein ACRDH2_19315, partial [Anaerolineales bacterium]